MKNQSSRSTLNLNIEGPSSAEAEDISYYAQEPISICFCKGKFVTMQLLDSHIRAP